MDSIAPKSRERQEGFSLIELTMALAVTSVLLVSGGLTLVVGAEQRREAWIKAQSVQSIESLIADVQNVANLDQDLGAGEGIGAIFERYGDQVIDIPGVQDGFVIVLVHADEATVPVSAGGPQDLNYDGDAADDLGNASNGTDLKCVPMQFIAYWVDSERNEARIVAIVTRLVTKTAG